MLIKGGQTPLFRSVVDKFRLKCKVKLGHAGYERIELIEYRTIRVYYVTSLRGEEGLSHNVTTCYVGKGCQRLPLRNASFAFYKI